MYCAGPGPVLYPTFFFFTLPCTVHCVGLFCMYNIHIALCVVCNAGLNAISLPACLALLPVVTALVENTYLYQTLQLFDIGTF